MAPNDFIDQELTALRAQGFSRAAVARFWRSLSGSAAGSAAARPELVAERNAILVVGLVVALAMALALAGSGVPIVLAVVLLCATWLVLCGWVGVELGLVRHPLSGEPGRRIGTANVMTLYRGWAAAPVLLLGLFTGAPSMAWVLLCLTAGTTDLVDGTVAIRLRQETRLGRLLDPVVDAFFFSAAAAGLARWHLLPAWVAALVALRYFAPIAGGLVLMFARGHTLPVRHTPWGQRSTFAVSVALLATWVASLRPVPAWVLPALYLAAVATMALALAGIMRRTPAEP